MFHLIWMFIVGIVVGAIAKWILPVGPISLFMTGLVAAPLFYAYIKKELQASGWV
jgi:uncharacterized membrane protein YeaQ/YmgE (transglycosylase-associated protein family)